jgi:hypothetical protein
MAAADLNPSRREVLGAAFAVPLLGAAALTRHSGLDPESIFLVTAASVEGRWMPDRARHDAGGDAGTSFAVTKWDRALSRFRRAEAAVLALEGGPDEDAFGRAHDRFNLVLRRLLAVPAPDIAALATKLEIAVAAELADLTYAPPALAALAQDARRLASRAVR